jgi:hypothetical protein
MDPAFQRRKFTELRLEYYVSGRMLWFNDTSSMAGMLLGYAVELSLKYILIAAGVTNQRLLNSHKVHKLFLECMTRKLIPNVEASEDLLLYVSDMFNQRYPSQVVETATEVESRGHALAWNPGLICGYDDLMIQLDDSLRRQCEDDTVSIGLLAAHFVNRVQGRSFFHCNVAALKNTATYRDALVREYEGSADRMKAEGLTEQTVQYNLGLHRQRLETWSAAPASVWHYDKMATAVGPDFETLRHYPHAKTFAYPGRTVKHGV